MQDPQPSVFRRWLDEQVVGNLAQVAMWLLSSQLVAALVMIWAAISGLKGVELFVLGIVALACVMAIVLMASVLQAYGVLSMARLKTAGVIGMLVVFLVSTTATLKMSAEIEQLRQDASKVPEDPDHAEALLRGSRAEERLGELRPELTNVQGQNDLLTAQLTMATTRINDLEEILNQRGRITRTRTALAKSQQDGIALRKECASVEYNDYVLKLGKWRDSVRVVLESNG